MSVVFVRDIMSSPVITLFAEQTMPLADDLMRFKKLRHLPVVDDDGCLVGLVTHHDVLSAQLSVLSGIDRADRVALQDGVRVRELMAREIWTVTPDTTAEHAGRLLLDHRFGCLPVLDADRRVIGIVTERDFLKFALKELAHGPP
jgi:CBS domain-containing protein